MKALFLLPLCLVLLWPSGALENCENEIQVVHSTGEDGLARLVPTDPHLRVPFVVKGSFTSKWTAVNSWTEGALREREVQLPALVKAEQGPNSLYADEGRPLAGSPMLPVVYPPQEAMSLQQLLDRMAAGEHLYFSAPLESVPGLAKDIDAADLAHLQFPGTEPARVLWIGHTYTAQAHYDRADNWFVQLLGTKVHPS